MYDLLAILADGQFHSGTEIGKALGISRAAIWKRMQKVQQVCGCEVESVPGKGYRLLQQVELLCLERLQDICGPGLHVEFLKTVDSTNDYAKRLIREGRHVDVVFAEEQTQGKGRRGRAWQSPYAANLYLSFVWPVSYGMRQLEGLSLVVGLAVQRCISELGWADVGLKWPNDVLSNDKKIAGILLELVGDLADQSHVVIGIGINVNMQGDISSIDQPWTSIAQEFGHGVSRYEVIRSLIAHLIRLLDELKASGFSALQNEWEDKHLWHGKQVVVSSGTSQIEGQAIGVNERGELKLKTADGVEYIAGGELSLRLANDS